MYTIIIETTEQEKLEQNSTIFLMLVRNTIGIHYCQEDYTLCLKK